MMGRHPRPRVGISRCLLGDEVRYDGTHRRNEALIETFGRLVEWVAVCPEVEVGMGTPREPIRLMARADGERAGSGRVRLMGVTSGEDWTGRMQAWTEARVRELAALELSGYVLKARSPSCGIRDVLVYADPESTAVTRDGRGVFARALVEAMPDLPVEDEERLGDPRVAAEFLRRVLAFTVAAEAPSPSGQNLPRPTRAMRDGRRRAGR